MLCYILNNAMPNDATTCIGLVVAVVVIVVIVVVVVVVVVAVG